MRCKLEPLITPQSARVFPKTFLQLYNRVLIFYLLSNHSLSPNALPVILKVQEQLRVGDVAQWKSTFLLRVPSLELKNKN